KVNSGEYKLMGLAPYGEPAYVDVIYRELVDLREDGSFTLNQNYFNYLTGLTMTNGAFDRLFGGPPRVPESPLTQREMTPARSGPSSRRRRSRRAWRRTGRPTSVSSVAACSAAPPSSSPRERSWGGSTDGWNSAPERSAPAASSAIRGTRACRRR